MAKKKSRQDLLVERLHAQGLRKRVAAAVAGARGGSGSGRKAETRGRDVLKQLEGPTDTIRNELLAAARKRSEACKKAAATRRLNAAKRSSSAKKGPAPRKAA